MCSVYKTYTNTNSIETKNGYKFVFSTSVDNKEREERIKRMQETKGKRCRGKGKVDQKGLEQSGVAMIFSPQMWKRVKDFEQINGRLMHATIKTRGKDTTIVNVYAPQSLRSYNENQILY